MSLLQMGADQMVAPFIDGALVPSQTGSTIDVIDPSSGHVRLEIPAGCDADVDRAVSAARSAFDDGRWSEAPPSVRKRVLHRFAELIAADATLLDELDAGEMGKPVSEARANAASAAALMRFYAEAVDKLNGDVFPSDRHSLVLERRVPRGVVAAVVPWNFPTNNAVVKIAPALAAGNCVILKPSELASRSAVRIAHLGMEAGLPTGALNVVPGLGETVGRALGLHMDVDMVAFTGSSEVGKLMLEYSSRSNMKAVQAECGGKSPHLVFADGIDIAAASEAIATRLLTNQGQVCSVGSRLIVERSVEPEVVGRIATRLSRIVIGDALDPQTTFGPLASSTQYERVTGYIASAHADGAHLVLGGERVRRDGGGYFVQPTIFRDVPSAARIAQEEVFGPVLSVIPFDDEAEAVGVANGTVYGLAAYVWTNDLSRAMRLAKAIRSPVWVNSVPPIGESAGRSASFEPSGLSGIGVEGGLAGMETYMRRQLMSFTHG